MSTYSIKLSSIIVACIVLHAPSAHSFISPEDELNSFLNQRLEVKENLTTKGIFAPARLDISVSIMTGIDTIPDRLNHEVLQRDRDNGYCFKNTANELSRELNNGFIRNVDWSFDPIPREYSSLIEPLKN